MSDAATDDQKFKGARPGDDHQDNYLTHPSLQCNLSVAQGQARG